MAFLDFGATEGLAYKHDWAGERQQEQENERLDRQARQDAETRTALLGDKIKFAHVQNPYDRTKLDEQVKTILPKIGKLIAENPDWQSNPQAYMTLNSLSNSLVDNDWVNRDMRFQAEKKKLTDFIATNPDATDLVAPQLDQVKNYGMTGDIHGVPGKLEEYSFQHPAAKFDPDAWVDEVMKNVKMQDISKLPGNREHAYKIYGGPLTDQTAFARLQQGENGKKLKAYYNALPDEEKGKSYQDWATKLARERYNTEVKAAGSEFDPNAAAMASMRNASSTAKQPTSYWYDFLKGVKAKPGVFHNIPSKDGAAAILGDNGQFNLVGMEIMNENEQPALFDGKPIKLNDYPTNNLNFSNSKIRDNGNGTSTITADAVIDQSSLDDIVQSKPSWLIGGFVGPFGVRDGFENVFKQFKEEGKDPGNPRPRVGFKVSKTLSNSSLESNNTAAIYGNTIALKTAQTVNQGGTDNSKYVIAGHSYSYDELKSAGYQDDQISQLPKE